MPSKKDHVQLRTKQREQIGDEISKLKQSITDFNEKQATLVLLQSVAEGLYSEIDKLAKKSPADQVTNLLLTQVNDIIREAKQLTPDDPFMKRYSEFVAAGDNPEHRDVIVIVKQIQQGLLRFATSLKSKKEKANQLLADAEGIAVALDLYLDGHTTVDRDDLKLNKVKLSQMWLTEGFNPSFDFEELDSIDIEEHFKVI